MAESARPAVYLLASPETAPSVLYGLYDVFATTGVAFDELVACTPGHPALEERIAARSHQPFRCIWDVLVEPHVAIDEVANADAVVVCDMYVPVDQSPRGRYPDEVGFIRRVHAEGALIASVCSGSLLLADTGLLDGHDTASHWAYRDTYRRHFPAVNLRPQDVLTLSGEDGRIITAGGVTAWQDLAVHLIARLCGRRAAIDVAKVHLITAHDEGQLPYGTMLGRLQKTDSVISECQVWIARNYHTAHPVSRMAERAGLGQRTFARRFYAATGYQPMDYVHALRVEEAKQYLESEPQLRIDEIGYRVGYEDAAYFRQLFKRKTGLTPARYRKKFARMLETPADGHPRRDPRGLARARRHCRARWDTPDRYQQLLFARAAARAVRGRRGEGSDRATPLLPRDCQ